jgi:type VI protein secretion system component Hcp
MPVFINFGPQIWGGTKDPTQRKTHDSDVLSFAWGRPHPAASVTRPGQGQKDLEPLPPLVNEAFVTKCLDSASRKIEIASESGEHLPQCVVLMRPSGPGNLTKVTLDDCIVFGWQVSGSVEQFGLNFARVRVEQPDDEDEDGPETQRRPRVRPSWG